MIELLILIAVIGILIVVAMHNEHSRNKCYHAGCYEHDCVQDYHQIIGQKEVEIERVPIVPTVVP